MNIITPQGSLDFRPAQVAESREKTICQLPKDSPFLGKKIVDVTYSFERQMNFLESIFSGLIRFFSPNYFTQTVRTISHIQSTETPNFNLETSQNDTRRKAVRISLGDQKIYIPRGIDFNQVVVRVYDEKEEIKAAFIDEMKKNPELRRSYLEEDWRFLEDYLAPQLIDAQNALIALTRKDPSKEYVISTKQYVGHEEKHLRIDTSTLSEHSFIKKYLDANGKISVKLKKDGTIIFTIPINKHEGGFKKGQLKILSSFDMPQKFAASFKLALRDDKKKPNQKAQFDAELRNDFSSILPTMVPSVGMQVISGGKIRSVYSKPGDPQIAILRELESKSSIILADYTKALNDQLNIMADVMEQVEGLHKRGLVHHDLKPENILIFDDPKKTFHAQIADFGLLRRVGEVTDGRIHGTTNFFIPGAIGDIGKDKYAIGEMLFILENVFLELRRKIDTTGCSERESKQILRKCRHVLTKLHFLARDLQKTRISMGSLYYFNQHKNLSDVARELRDLMI
jgi:hypothetical protein